VSPETEIAADASHAPRYSHLSPGSWNADGHLLVSLHATWFTAPAVLDTRNGHVQPLPFDKTSDYANMAWLGRAGVSKSILRVTCLDADSEEFRNPRNTFQIDYFMVH
jgi:hypothetical protein